jgi:hypothetical protein
LGIGGLGTGAAELAEAAAVELPPDITVEDKEPLGAAAPTDVVEAVLAEEVSESLPAQGTPQSTSSIITITAAAKIRLVLSMLV